MGWSCPSVLAHLDDPADEPDTAGLIRALVADRRSPAVAVVAATGRTDQGLELLRLGAAEFLPRPFDVSRLAYLLDTLTVCARARGRAAACTGRRRQRPLR